MLPDLFILADLQITVNWSCCRVSHQISRWHSTLGWWVGHSQAEQSQNFTPEQLNCVVCTVHSLMSLADTQNWR